MCILFWSFFQYFDFKRCWCNVTWYQVKTKLPEWRNYCVNFERNSEEFDQNFSTTWLSKQWCVNGLNSGGFGEFYWTILLEIIWDMCLKCCVCNTILSTCSKGNSFWFFFKFKFKNVTATDFFYYSFKIYLYYLILLKFCWKFRKNN